MNPAKGAYSVRWSDLPEESVVDGVTRQRLDAQQMTVLRYCYQPGARFPAHRHPEEQVVLVLSGQIEFTVDQHTVRVSPGAMLVIPPSVVHSARVIGDELVDTINILSPRRTGGITLASDKD